MTRKEDFSRFADALGANVPPDARLLFCQFRGDPNADIKGKWRAHVYKEGMVDQKSNVYFCVSAMKRNARGEFRRRKENFAGGLCLMIDDIGEGEGAKFSRDILDPLAPSAMIETSPGNFQAVYLFDQLIESMETFDALINAFIARQFLSKDTGMAGVNRVFRPPIGVNGKAKYGGWEVRAETLDLDRRYSVEQIVQAFDLDLQYHRPAPLDLEMAKPHRAEHEAFFAEVARILQSVGMMKSRSPDVGGWVDIVCPWTDEHSGGVDNGAAIRVPSEENYFNGAFRCHHGSCAERHWGDLARWIDEEVIEELRIINERRLDQRHRGTSS